MASENPAPRATQRPRSASENTDAALRGYTAALARAPLAAATRRTYTSKVRGYLMWLATADVDGDPLGEPQARDWAVRDYRTWLVTVAKRAPATVNNTLAAIDDFYTRRGLGPAAAGRLDLPAQAPRALDDKAALRWLRAINAHPAPRDRVLALLPFYAALRIAETVALDLDDIALSARKGTLRVRGKGATVRELPVHPQLRAELALWLDERPNWPGAGTSPALLLNRRGGRLSVRGASSIIQPSPATPDSTTASPPTSAGTPSPPRSSAAAPTSWSSPTCSATLVSTPSAPTPGPPKMTVPRPSTCSPQTADQLKRHSVS